MSGAWEGVGFSVNRYSVLLSAPWGLEMAVALGHEAASFWALLGLSLLTPERHAGKDCLVDVNCLSCPYKPQHRIQKAWKCRSSQRQVPGTEITLV